MIAVSGLHATPSSAAPKDDITAQGVNPKALLRRLAALEATVTAQNAKIADLQETVAAQQTQIAVQAAKLAPVSVSGTVFTISGVNVRVVDGSGSTASTLGLGNLAIGYNAEQPLGGTNIRTGSQNLIVGDYNCTSYGGLVAGRFNGILGPYASVSGGQGNIASGNYGSVSGGAANMASGNYASVGGGYGNTASALGSKVDGGRENIASGNYSTVSGGYSRSANFLYDWVTGTLLQAQ
jgi:hypothetical protein